MSAVDFVAAILAGAILAVYIVAVLMWLFRW